MVAHPGGNAVNQESDLHTIRLDVTLFFQRNPSARETASSVALRTGRPTAAVIDALERLAEQRVLERRGQGETALYRYVRPFLARGTEHS